MLISLCTEKKKIPSQAIKALLAEKIEEHTDRHGEEPSRKEIKDLKDASSLELVPRAFTAQSHVRFLFSADKKWVAVDCSSQGSAEKALEFLRNNLGSLKVVPLQSSSVERVLTSWLNAKETPETTSLTGTCSLTDNDGGTVSCVNLDLFGDEIQNHLSSGKTVVKMTILYDDRISFSLDKTLVLKSINYDGSMHPELNDDDMDEVAQAAYLIDGWLATLAPELNSLFGFIGGEFAD